LNTGFFLFKRFVGTALPTIGKKLLLDQCVITPPILAIFYVGNNTPLSSSRLFGAKTENLRGNGAFPN
jgi:hypothetical protein